jgi:hypothetical protein
MVLSTPCVNTLLSTWLLLSLAHCSLALSLSSQSPSTVDEVDGMMYVTEPVSTFRMDRHIQLWAADLHGQRDMEKLDLLLASKTIREMSLLMSYLKAQAAQGTSTTLPWMATDSSPALPTTLNSDNQLQRYKRNILGDVLHALTRVATDEELAKQRQLDEDIRNPHPPDGLREDHHGHHRQHYE